MTWTFSLLKEMTMWVWYSGLGCCLPIIELSTTQWVVFYFICGNHKIPSICSLSVQSRFFDSLIQFPFVHCIWLVLKHPSIHPPDIYLVCTLISLLFLSLSIHAFPKRLFLITLTSVSNSQLLSCSRSRIFVKSINLSLPGWMFICYCFYELLDLSWTLRFDL